MANLTRAALLIIDVQAATYLVADACFTFARRDFHGRLRSADEVHSMSLANLHQEYCTVLDTDSVLTE